MTSFDQLVAEYDAGRLGYSNDVYNHIAAFGLLPKHAILDIGCGTGLASAPLIENGYDVTGVDPSEAMLEVARERFAQAKWVRGVAESLPFEAGTFDVAISAQAFHHADARKAIAEIKRVLRPNGIIAIWWKSLMSDSPIKQLRDSIARDMGLPPLVSSWRGGFREFYASGFRDTAVRVVPWSTISTLNKFLHYERSRKIVRDDYGVNAQEYFELLEARLRETFGEGDPIVPLAYTHFLYLARL
ncbi:MAG TPA: methyltransferase domain-containing protein [Candidatus Acidoferrales bacterium]|nr:methyltransferase domain-containing protein [Candidatus Acidoferrales bacterium]